MCLFSQVDLHLLKKIMIINLKEPDCNAEPSFECLILPISMSKLKIVEIVIYNKVLIYLFIYCLFVLLCFFFVVVFFFVCFFLVFFLINE